MSVPAPQHQRGERLVRYAGWLPAAGVAVLCVVRNLRLVAPGDVFAATSILTGFLFGTLVFVFQLRMRVTDDPHVPSFGKVRTFIDSSFGRLTEATSTALLVTAVTAFADVTLDHAAKEAAVGSWLTAVIGLLAVRLLTLMPLVLWDLYKAYGELPG